MEEDIATRQDEKQETGDKPKRRGWMRRLYDWVLHWAETPYGAWALGILSVMESSFFPVPPDPLLIVLVLGKRTKAMFYAALTTITSAVGGVGGWLIGMFLMDLVGHRIIDFYGAQEQFNYVQEMYNEWGVWFLFTAALTPIPYKVFTIASGAFGMSIVPFFIVSLIGRGLRFFVVSGLIYLFGPPIQRFIDKYFNLLAILFVVLLVGGFAAVKYLWHESPADSAIERLRNYPCEEGLVLDRTLMQWAEQDPAEPIGWDGNESEDGTIEVWFSYSKNENVYQIEWKVQPDGTISAVDELAERFMTQAEQTGCGGGD